MLMTHTAHRWLLLLQTLNTHQLAHPVKLNRTMATHQTSQVHSI